ncbi:MAG: hydrogenase iron-sulfur subunit [bacterium]
MTKVFVSRENGRVSSLADLDALKKRFQEMQILHNFSRDENLDVIAKDVKGSDAVILAGPEQGFYDIDEGKKVINALTGAGINRNRIFSVDLSTAMHPKDVAVNTATAGLLIGLAVKNAQERKPFEYLDSAPEQGILIIGSDPSGILLAKSLLEEGHPVSLINRGAIPASKGWWSSDYESIAGHKQFKAFPSAAIKGFSGFPGQYSVELEKSDGKSSVKCGVIAIATSSDLPYNQDIHAVFHIPLGLNKELIPLSNGGSSCRTRYPQIFILPAGAEREGLQEKLKEISAAAKAFLTQKSYRHFFDVASVNEETCGACGTCVKTCMFGASNIDMNKKVSVVDRLKCVGCGNCVTACPTGARELKSYPAPEIFQRIHALPNAKKCTGLIFACEGSGYPTIESMARLGMTLPEGFCTVRIRCGAHLDTQFISEAINQDFKGVAVICCKESRCLNDVGSLDLSRRFNLYRAVMRAKGIDANLLRIITIENGDTESCNTALTTFAKYLKGGNHE